MTNPSAIDIIPIVVAVMMAAIPVALVWYKRWMVSHALIVTTFGIYIVYTASYVIWGQAVIAGIYGDFGFRARYLATGEAPYTLITSAFIHGTAMHILMNMLVLTFLGPPLEEKIGSSNFAFLYFFTAVGGQILSGMFTLLFPSAPVIGGSADTIGIGASGAVFGIMGAFAAMYPNEKVPMLLFIIYLQKVPVYFVALMFMAIETVYVMAGASDGVGHMVHIGSLACGVATVPMLRMYMDRPKAKNQAGVFSAARKQALGKIEELATTNELKDALARMSKEDDEPVRKAWIGYFVERAVCPKCGQKLYFAGDTINCKCGFAAALESEDKKAV